VGSGGVIESRLGLGMAQTGYDLIALDLDGTLLSSDGTLSRENLRAVERARAAGMRVTICTGRGYKECRRYLDELGQKDPVVVAGGSIIADPASGETIHRFTLEQPLVANAVGRLLGHRLPALVLKDPSEVGYDYLVVHGAERLPLDPVTTWWFAEMGVHARYVEDVTHDEHPEHTVRFGVCGMSGQLQAIQEDLHAAFGEETQIHHFPAVVAPEHASRSEDGQVLHVLEVFARDGNKRSALEYVAGGMGISLARCVAMGDQINDLPMLGGVGLGIAMGNAVEQVRQISRKATLRNDEHGVAHAIGQVLCGAW